MVEEAVRSEMFQKSYGEVFDGSDEWNALEVPEGDRYAWQDDSTYVRRPSFLEDVPPEPEDAGDIEGARVLALLGDSVTTDHISPAGAIKKGSPAALYLNEHGVEQAEFNSYGARRGNHEVMMRGTFANIRLRNLLAGRDDLVGGLTLKFPEGESMPIYDAAMAYAEEGTPLVVLAGKEYGSGSSRDWAAKGTNLLGVRAVIAQSFERIHRSNLVGMGVLPLQFPEGESAGSLGLTGEEEFSITGIENGEAKEVQVRAGDKEFTARVRIDTPKEVQYFQHGGILPFVLRQLLRELSSGRGGPLDGGPARVALVQRRLGGAAAADAEQALRVDQVRADREVDEQREDLERREAVGDLVELERQQRGGGDEREVLRPALPQPQADRLDPLDDREQRHDDADPLERPVVDREQPPDLGEDAVLRPPRARRARSAGPRSRGRRARAARPRSRGRRRSGPRAW